MDLGAILDLLREKGVAKASIEFDNGIEDPARQVRTLSVEFGPDPTPVGFVDEKGQPVNFDEGAPPLARDPDDEPSDDEIERVNFDRDKAA